MSITEALKKFRVSRDEFNSSNDEEIYTLASEKGVGLLKRKSHERV